MIDEKMLDETQRVLDEMKTHMKPSTATEVMLMENNYQWQKELIRLARLGLQSELKDKN